ncbi:MAG: lytic transglycosylase domain-containing protein [Clostridia bacterium]|nr:lytic transglycosylase domain-containing protein [Clostridia bacterium]
MKIIKKLIILLLIIVLIISLIRVFNLKDIILKNIYPIAQEEYVEKYAKEFNIDKYYIYAIIKAESDYNVEATSNKGARGLMQLMDETAVDVAEKLQIELNEYSLYNPEQNIMLGTKYFADLLQRYNNELLAIAAYNAGPGNVNRWINDGNINIDGTNIENIPYKETNMYVRKIINNYKIYTNLYN